MNKTKIFAALAALTITLATPSLFADNRRQETTEGWRGNRNHSRHVTVAGRIRDIDRDRNQIVIRLNRGDILVATADTRVESVRNERGGRGGLRRLEEGDTIRATGNVERGRMYVDSIVLVRQEDDRRDADDRFLTGVVQSVDRRADVIWVAERRTGRVVAVDVRRVDRNSHRFDVDDVRRGSRITVRGDWQRNGRFEAERVEIERGAYR